MTQYLPAIKIVRTGYKIDYQEVDPIIVSGISHDNCFQVAKAIIGLTGNDVKIQHIKGYTDKKGVFYTSKTLPDVFWNDWVSESVDYIIEG